MSGLLLGNPFGTNPAPMSSLVRAHIVPRIHQRTLIGAQT